MKWKKFKYYIRLRNIVIESIPTYNNTLLVCSQRRQRVGFEKELYFMVKQDFLSSTKLDIVRCFPYGFEV